QNLGNFVEPSGGDAIDPTLVFVRLLIGDADQVRQLLLSQAQHDTTLAHPRTDVAVDILRSTGRAARCGGAVGQGVALGVTCACVDGFVPLSRLGHSSRLMCRFKVLLPVPAKRTSDRSHSSRLCRSALPYRPSAPIRRRGTAGTG